MAEEKRNEMAEKRALELVESYLKAKNMRVLFYYLNKITWKIFTNSKLNQFKLTQKIFSTWYGLILDNRIKMGKAQAMADWRLSYKVFNSWKRISVTEKVKKDQELYQYQVKIENIKNAKAVRFYNNKLLEK